MSPCVNQSSRSRAWSVAHWVGAVGVLGIVCSLLVFALAVYSVQGLKGASERVFVAKDVTADILPPPMYLIEMRLVLSALSEGSMPLEVAKREVSRLTADYQSRVDYWTKNPPLGLERWLMGAQHEEAQRFIKQVGAVLNAAEAGEPAVFKDALSHAYATFLKHREGVDMTVRESVQFATVTQEAFVAMHRRTVITQVACLLLLSALMVGLVVVIGRRISRPLRAMMHQARELADGVLPREMADVPDARSTEETEALASAMRTMVAQLSTVVQSMRIATDSIQVASTEIATGNQDLSSRTEQTASNLEETAASMEQLTSTVRNSADAARQANQLAASAAQIASRGGEVVSQVVSTMDEINHSSKKINDIIGVIDGIAFQTNILALNAAVEAARAGEQGRGFAVVAGEVRNLAQRSAQAAKEIKGLIGASVERVEAGSRLVADAGQTMSEIVGSVQRVSDIIGEITAAAGEQSDGIAQVNTAVSQLDQMTQQNAALVEQSAAAAQSLREQAARLAETAQAFQIKG
jgi:methyl-accepting chemotaxis protein